VAFSIISLKKGLVFSMDDEQGTMKKRSGIWAQSRGDKYKTMRFIVEMMKRQYASMEFLFFSEREGLSIRGPHKMGWAHLQKERQEVSLYPPASDSKICPHGAHRKRQIVAACGMAAFYPRGRGP
jgi:hypothetical protein